MCGSERVNGRCMYVNCIHYTRIRAVCSNVGKVHGGDRFRLVPMRSARAVTPAQPMRTHGFAKNGSWIVVFFYLFFFSRTRFSRSGSVTLPNLTNLTLFAGILFAAAYAFVAVDVVVSTRHSPPPSLPACTRATASVADTPLPPPPCDTRARTETITTFSSNRRPVQTAPGTRQRAR